MPVGDADQAAQIGILVRKRFDRFALAAKRIPDVVSQKRTGNVDFDGARINPRAQTVAGVGRLLLASGVRHPFVVRGFELHLGFYPASVAIVGLLLGTLRLPAMMKL